MNQCFWTHHLGWIYVANLCKCQLVLIYFEGRYFTPSFGTKFGDRQFSYFHLGIRVISNSPLHEENSTLEFQLEEKTISALTFSYGLSLKIVFFCTSTRPSPVKYQRTTLKKPGICTCDSRWKLASVFQSVSGSGLHSAIALSSLLLCQTTYECLFFSILLIILKWKVSPRSSSATLPETEPRRVSFSWFIQLNSQVR